MNKKPYSVCITSGKGGTGKSIISASISYILAHCGFKTLLVDMDLFTHGLTYYVLAEYPRDSPYFTADLFQSESSIYNFKPILIPHYFTKNNLEFAPSIKRTGRPKAEWGMIDKLSNFNNFLGTMNLFIHHLSEKNKYDYIIIDTRGGADITSVGSSIATKAYIIVTEADKPSWDMGRLLIDTIDSYQNELNYETDRIGFIINKNVLPPEAIEVFLKKEWQSAHLATIPLDENAVRYYQEDKIPVAEKIHCQFSLKILEIIRKTFVDENWTKENMKSFENIEQKAIKEKKQKEMEIKKKKNAIKLGITVRGYIYSILLIFLYINETYNIFSLGTTQMSILFSSIIIIIIMMIGFEQIIYKIKIVNIEISGSD